MKTDSEIRSLGMEILVEKLGLVEAQEVYNPDFA